jgi:hypothetical protein
VGAWGEPLDRIIAEAWRVFDLPAPQRTGVCEHCCMDPKVEREILKKSARDLTLRDIQSWHDAVTIETFGFAQMGWLLPRIMELLADGEEVDRIGEEISLARLAAAGFPSEWSKERTDVVERFCLALLAQRIEQNYSDLDALLCMFSRAGLDLAPFIDHLDSTADEKLADLLHANWSQKNVRGEDISSICQTGFWDDERARVLTFSWYTSASLQDRMIRLGIAGNENAAEVSDVQAMYGHAR